METNPSSKILNTQNSRLSSFVIIFARSWSFVVCSFDFVFTFSKTVPKFCLSCKSMIWYRKVQNLSYYFSGTRVTQVSATDTEGNTISYEIGSDANGKFSIDQSSGWITSNISIDREVGLHRKILSFFLKRSMRFEIYW